MPQLQSFRPRFSTSAPATFLGFCLGGLLCLQIAASPAQMPAPSLSRAPSQAPAQGTNPFGDLSQVSNSPNVASTDRLAILNLIGAYSHLADGLHTEAFGEFFTPDGIFEIVPHSDGAKTIRQRVGKGRAEIVNAMRTRHAEFRRDGIQRRHFLTNPVVWEQTDSRARVAVYLQLRSSERGGPSKLVGTGRYEGVAIKTPEGWRMAEWTILSDQEIR